MYEIKFEWDEVKAEQNLKKHKVSFETATHVFEDINYIEVFDFEHSTDEDRYIVIGRVEEVLFVVYTEHGDRIRLISARLADDEEEAIYYGGIYTNRR